MAKTDTGTEEVVTQPAAMHDAASILAGLNIEELVRGQVETLVNQRLAEEASKALPANASVEAETRKPNYVEPPTYLRHYRCDTSPNLVVFARSIDKEAGKFFKPSEWSTDAKQYKNRDPLEGERIQFRRGHFFATEQWQVDQLDWMMEQPQYEPGGDPLNPKVRGGNPHIYVDDGLQVGKCPYCDEPFIPGSNALKAHLRATHGVIL